MVDPYFSQRQSIAHLISYKSQLKNSNLHISVRLQYLFSPQKDDCSYKKMKKRVLRQNFQASSANVGSQKNGCTKPMGLGTVRKPIVSSFIWNQ